MRKNIQINIPDPCHENWDRMLPAERGKFCNACQKDVIDFTAMSDARLVAFFRRPATDSICGRFMQNQLDRTIEVPKNRIPWVKYFFQFALPAFLASSKAAAQGKIILTGDTVVVANTKKDRLEKSELAKVDKRIYGKIIDQDDQGIPFASIFIKGTTSGTATDSSGFFELKYEGSENEITLTSSCLGFQNMETSIDIRDNKTITISLQKNVELLNEVKVIAYASTMGKLTYTGAVSVVKTCSWKTKIIDTLSSFLFFSNLGASIYPNPAKSNSKISIKFGKHKNGTYSMELINLSGQILFRKEQWIDAGTDVIQLHLPSVAAGVYLVRLINRQSTKTITGKIIID